MTKTSLALSAFMIVAGTVFIITGMSTSNVIKVCHMKPPPPPRMPPPPPGIGFAQVLSIKGGRPENKNEGITAEDEICMEQGFFFVRFSLPGAIFYIPTPLELRSQMIRVVAGLLLVGGTISLIAALFFTVASCQADDENSKLVNVTAARNKTGTIILALSFFLLLIGMSVYTNQKIKIVGNPEQFMSQIVSALYGVDDMLASSPESKDHIKVIQNLKKDKIRRMNKFSKTLMIHHFSNGKYTSKHNMDIPVGGNVESMETYSGNSSTPNSRENSENFMKNVGEESFFADDYPFRNSSKVTNQRNKRSPRSGGLGLMKMIGMRSSLFSQPSEVHPVMGYSFYLLWIGCLLKFSALVLGIVRWACHTKNIKLQDCKV